MCGDEGQVRSACVKGFSGEGLRDVVRWGRRKRGGLCWAITVGRVREAYGYPRVCVSIALCLKTISELVVV